MIITRTPLRISLFGGGTDFPGWFLKHGGLTVGGAISCYVYLTVRELPPYHPHKTRLAYSRVETVASNGDVSHPAARACLAEAGFLREGSPGLEISHLADVPGRCGLGTSSAFVVGLLNALYSQKKEFLSPRELAEKAVKVERQDLGEAGGWQDQAWAAHGGVNCLKFETNGNVNRYPLPLDRDSVIDLEAHLALYFTGTTRTGPEVSRGYQDVLAENGRHQWASLRFAEEGAHALARRDWRAAGVLLDKAWQLKRALPGVTDDATDRLVATGRMAGAWGGKLLGAGGGGCLLFCRPPEAAPALDRAMAASGLVKVPFTFDDSGSRVVFCDGRP